MLSKLWRQASSPNLCTAGESKWSQELILILQMWRNVGCISWSDWFRHFGWLPWSQHQMFTGMFRVDWGSHKITYFRAFHVVWDMCLFMIKIVVEYTVWWTCLLWQRLIWTLMGNLGKAGAFFHSNNEQMIELQKKTSHHIFFHAGYPCFIWTQLEHKLYIHLVNSEVLLDFRSYWCFFQDCCHRAFGLWRLLWNHTESYLCTVQALLHD